MKRLARCSIGVVFLTLGLLLGMGWESPSHGEDLNVPYTVSIEGVGENGIRSELSAVSTTVELKNEPPATLGLLRRRAVRDVPRLLDALRARGYYGAEVDVRIDESKDPVAVVFHVEAGSVYTLKSVRMEVEGDGDLQTKLPSLEELDLKLNGPALAKPILSAHEALLKRLRTQGFALAKVPEPQVLVDHTAREVAVTYRIEPGPESKFGETQFSGLTSVRERYVRKLLPWRTGERFDAALFAEAQKRFTDTQLFSLINISHADSLDESGLLPITIELRERKHRTVSAGASYYTDEGPGFKLGWEHRNLFHEGEKLSFEAKVSGIGISGETSYRKPAFLRPDQSLLTSFRIAEDDTEAYVSDNTELTLLVERQLKKGMRVGVGPSFRLAQVEQLGVTNEFALFSLPTFFEWDASDNPLNPTRGFRFNVKGSPFFQDTLNTDLRFIKAYASYSHYFRLLERPSLVFAARTALGTMGGASRDGIPADVRFYAGGGGSVRGYPFQTAGPLVGEIPIGGRSLLELSGELRWRITEKIGAVVFMDGGSAFESVFPDFEEDILWGVGTGFRYFTPLGPVRLDVATPLNRRDNVDDIVQVYISIGQAF